MGHFTNQRPAAIARPTRQHSNIRRHTLSVPPYALALVIADAIHRDPGTGKRTILGCFSSIYAREFPATHPALAVYIAVTEGRGVVPIKVRMVDVDDEKDPIFEVEGEANFQDPRMVMDMDLFIPNLVFPEPGEYRIQLFASGEPLLERRIMVLEARNQDTQEPKSDE